MYPSLKVHPYLSRIAVSLYNEHIV